MNLTDKIKFILESKLEGSTVLVLDPLNDSQHLEAVVTYKGFQGLSLLQQHQLVLNTLKEEFETSLHALKLTTKTPTNT